jgi:hypothetical protein
MKVIVVVNFIRPVYVIITRCSTPSPCTDENIGARKVGGGARHLPLLDILSKKQKLKREGN